MRKIISVTIVAAAVGLFTAQAVIAAPNPTLKADRQAINSACAADGQAAGCAGKEFGTGLLKCIWHYKRANRKTYKVSQGCRSATKKWRMDRQAILGH